MSRPEERRKKIEAMVDLRYVHIGLSSKGHLYCGTLRVNEEGGVEWNTRVDLTDEFHASLAAFLDMLVEPEHTITLSDGQRYRFEKLSDVEKQNDRKYFDFKPSDN